MNNEWFLRPRTHEQIKGSKIAEDLDLHLVVANLLVQRGIASTQEARAFMWPSLDQLYDPFVMDNMLDAVNRLNQALERREKILIYGDYDADGITAVALVYKCLRRYTSALDYYIPDRYDEGSGFSFQGAQYAIDNNYSLVIALDCGVKSIEQIAFAKEHGVDVIVCDHHRPDNTIPPAVAILDTKCPGSSYPFDHLCGCGVAFKFMQGFLQHNGLPLSAIEDLLDLVAVSIAADIVPIIGENRILAHRGLQQINHTPSPGIKGIMDICGLRDKKNVSAGDLIFKIGPLLNASGRMENGKESVALLLLSDRDEVIEKSKELNRYNDERREVDRQTTEEAHAAILAQGLDKHKAIIVFNPNFHKGVIGIVASRLSEFYHRPAIVLTQSAEFVTGSARSHDFFDVYRVVEECRDLVENFGGHPYAVGLSLRPENLPAFTQRFLAIVNAQDFVIAPRISIDAPLPLCQVTPKLLADLKRLSPFGQENQVPIFYTLNVRDVGKCRLVGKDNEHLRFDVIDDTSDTPVNAIAFNMAQYFELVASKEPFHICYTVEEFGFRSSGIQLLIKDIRTSDPFVTPP
ncbi:MAG: single-stranded-DNA-specific exonuclease RecJ [Tannerellaceae bacterium]|jgi:single-stranded-DNA-specific exonuclease|nr:single-stranded-DNA-specific exonuclease RecJ [Tannerellaceae bacterium]